MAGFDQRCHGVAGRLAGLAVGALVVCGPASADGQATIRLAQASVRAVDGITVDVNAGALRDGSTPRLVVVPAGTPDPIPDPTAFAAVSTAIDAGRVRLTLPPGPAGADEVRLYWIPRSGTQYVVAARAPISVGAGASGAVLARDLVEESVTLGEVRFEARYRDKVVLVQGQFLGAKPQAEWDRGWLLAALQRPVAIMEVGTRGNMGASAQALCFMPADDNAGLQRMAALNPGDPVTVRGTPSAWNTTFGQVLLHGCAFAD